LGKPYTTPAATNASNGGCFLLPHPDDAPGL
jgi:hypothetical protein